MVVRVNAHEISEQAINRESASFSSHGPREAQRQAAIALVIRTLLLEQAGQGPEVDDAVADAAIEAHLAEKVDVPTPDIASCRHYYIANPERFQSPTLVVVRHILMSAHPDDLEEQEQIRTQAEELIRQLQAQPERFEAFARRFSDCPSKEQGGHLGQVSRGQTVPELEDVMLRLPVGLAERPLKSRYGYHVVDILERIDGELLPFDVVLPKIRDYLTTKTRRRAISQYLQLLIGNARIEGVDLEGAGSPLVQ